MESYSNQDQFFEKPVIEDDEDLSTVKFTFDKVKWMSKQELETFFVRFSTIRVPMGPFERKFFYFKRYPKEFGKESFNKGDKSLYSFMNSANSNKSQNSSNAYNVGSLNLKSRTKPTQSKPKIQIKTFGNPMMLPEKKSKEDQFKNTTKKIVRDMPCNRSILVINFDKQYDEKFIIRVFGVMGKIRRVFAGNLSKKRTGKTG